MNDNDSFNCVNSVCSTGDVRLRAGSNHLEGRVEYCVDNLWGTVCSDGWGSQDTAVVCAQLGFIPQGKKELDNKCYQDMHTLGPRIA